MSHYDGGWAPYVPVAERRRRAEREMAKLRKSGHPVAPVTIAGRLIVTTFWGRAWCDNMESYRDYESRLPRGRTYVRNGSVVDLQVAAGKITARVSGSDLYSVTITIKEAAKPHWRAICADCAGGIASLVELLQGRLSNAVMERLCRQEGGLFPRPADIRFSCSCPDHAAMCKHVAAVLYGVGARLDHKPELLFRLRAVDENDLVVGIDTVLPLSKAGPAAGKVLETDDMAALFGLDMATGDATTVGKAPDKPKAAPGRRVPERSKAMASAADKLPAKPAAAQRATVAKQHLVTAVPPKQEPTGLRATRTKSPPPKPHVSAKASTSASAAEQRTAVAAVADTRQKLMQARQWTDTSSRTKDTDVAKIDMVQKAARRVGLQKPRQSSLLNQDKSR